MKRNKERFLLSVLCISMVTILSINLYDFIMNKLVLSSMVVSILSILICIICIIIIVSGKEYSINSNRKIKGYQSNRRTFKSKEAENNYFINLAHELRTPLNIILSTEQLITNLNSRNEHINKEKLSEYMNVLRGNSKRLLKLINDIIDTSRIERGVYELDIMEHEIVFFVEDLIFSMKEIFESKEIELIIDPDIEEKIIECDINDIEKCLLNLVGNAVKFTPRGGKILVRIIELPEQVKISIIDSGIGIDKKDIKEIFNRFNQVYNKKSEEFGGSGIGLMLTKQLVELHHGELIVESKLGKGSEFSIILPVKQLQ